MYLFEDTDPFENPMNVIKPLLPPKDPYLQKICIEILEIPGTSPPFHPAPPL